MVFTPHWPLALRAQARPPLPPPMTRKSHSLLMGAMAVGEKEKCREMLESLGSAVAAVRGKEERKKIEKDSLTTSYLEG